MCLPFNILFEVKRSGNFEYEKKNQRTKEKILLKNFEKYLLLLRKNKTKFYWVKIFSDIIHHIGKEEKKKKKKNLENVSKND